MKQQIMACLFSLVFLLAGVTAAEAAPRAKAPGTVSGFSRIGQGGFGDSANSYSWSVYWFKGNLYVGTNRHHLHSMFEALGSLPGSPISPKIMPDYLTPDPPVPATWFERGWAETFQGELWRYNQYKQWERVHQSGVLGPIALPPPLPTGPTGHVPVAYGYRAMTEFNGYLYACGIGTWMPPLPFNTIVRSSTGDPGTWEDVSGIIAQTTNIRAITTWKGKLYVAASVNGGAAVFASADPKTKGWTQVNAPGFGEPNNSEIYYMTVFNNQLYASTVNLVTGFELWKTDGVPGAGGQYAWTRVIKNGFGDTWNQYGMTMAVLGDHLYLGTAVGIGMVMKKNPATGQDEVVGTRALEVIRVDKGGNAELVVGAYEASDPIEGGPTPREPLSGMGAGFNNPFNVYAWNMNVYNRCLYLGTFDMSIFAIGALEKDPGILPFLLKVYAPDLPSELVSAISGAVTPQVLELLKRYFAGGDLWKSCDGVNWMPVTINGFNNFYNYGIREVIPVRSSGKDVGLAVGTANPFTGKPGGGCEIWFNGKVPGVPPAEK